MAGKFSAPGTSDAMSTDVANFDLNLSATDDTVQKALETLDDLVTGGGGGVASLAKSGDTPLTGAVTLTGGANITLTQVGQDISIAAASGSGSYFATLALYNGENAPFLTTSSASYAVMAMYAFPGTSTVGTPTAMKVIASIGAATSYDVKIFDVTNSLTIVESLTNTNSSLSIVDLGALANLPTGDAVFEIQLRRTGSGGQSAEIAGFISV